MEDITAQTRKDAAVDWFLRRAAGPLTADEVAEFEAWLKETPENPETYAAVETVWSAAAEVEEHPQVSAKRQAIIKAVDRARTTRRTVMAGLAVLIFGAGGLGWYSLVAPKPLVTQSFETAVGQQATVSLPDGSKVTLNTDTLVRTRADQNRRLVYLDRGQAFFRVAKDARHPFVVNAGGRTVTALGTAFEVRVDKGAFKVVLVEGKVRVDSAPRPIAGEPRPRARAGKGAVLEQPVLQSTEMTAGSELIARNDTDWRVTRTDVDRETSWLRGQIVFDDEELGDIVAELNRYSTRKIVIADPALAHERLSGIYTPGDLHGFSRALKSYGLAEVVNESESEVRVVALKPEKSPG